MLSSSSRTQELVALSGAHTLGSKGFGSPIVFDNSYYKVLLEKPWMSSGKEENIDGSHVALLDFLPDVVMFAY